MIKVLIFSYIYETIKVVLLKDASNRGLKEEALRVYDCQVFIEMRVRNRCRVFQEVVQGLLAGCIIVGTEISFKGLGKQHLYVGMVYSYHILKELVIMNLV